VLAPDEFRDQQRLARPGALPARLLLHEGTEGDRHDRVGHRGAFVEDAPVAQHAVGERAVVAERRLDAEEGLGLPPLQPGHDRLAAVGGEAARAAGDGAEHRFRRLHHAEGDEVAHRLHARDPRVAHVEHIGVPAHSPYAPVGEWLYESFERLRLDGGVGVDEHDHLCRGGANAGRHRRTLAAVLGEVDHLHAPVGLGRDAPHLGERVVGGAVVDRHQLELLRRVVELQKRAQRVRDRLLLVEAGHHDRDLRLDPPVRPRTVEEAEHEARDDVGGDRHRVHAEEHVVEQQPGERRLVGHHGGEQQHQVEASEGLQDAVQSEVAGVHGVGSGLADALDHGVKRRCPAAWER
jgi:hypothetical protein